MAKIDILTFAASKSYTDASIAGGGAIKGKNCQIKSSTAITGGTRIVFAWYLDNGTEQTTTVDMMDGAKGDTGLGIKSASIVDSHLILVMDNDTTVDAGLVSGFDTDMSHITDIDLNNLVDGQILKFNGITRKWENASAGTVDTSLVDLNDVDIDNLTDGQIIVWDATAGRWKNADNSPSITVDPTPTQGSNNAVASGGVYTALQNKVDKVSGKGLSTNDYTTAEKTKLTGIATGANKKHKKLYTLTANTWQASQSDYGVYTYSLTISDPYFDINEPLNVYFADGHNSYDDPYFNNAKYKVYKNIYNGSYGGSVEDYPSQLVLYYYDVENLTAPSTTINIYVEGIVKEWGV